MLIRGVSSAVDSINYNEGEINTEPRPARKIKSEHISMDDDINQRREAKYGEEDLIGSIESANKHFTAFDRRFEFSIHENTKQILVKVIDTNTDEVIREIPPEKILDMVAAMWEIAGIIVDERV